MSIVEHEIKIEVPYKLENVFSVVKEVATHSSKFEFERADDILKIVYLKTGVSAFSWGERIQIVCKKVEEGTEISIMSTPKTGLMFGGAFDMGKNRKNIDILLEEISRELQNNEN